MRLDASRLLHGDGPAGPAVRDGSYLGALFESLVVLSVRTYAQNCDAHPSHLRTQGGRHEVDLIVESDAGVLAIEATLSSSIGERDVFHLLWLRDQLGEACIDTIVVHTGPDAYRRRDGVGVIPLGLLRR